LIFEKRKEKGERVTEHEMEQRREYIENKGERLPVNL
jgi:hypothetical protein